MEPATFTAMKAMEALGYITRKQLPTNKKNMYVYLTPEGRALKEKLVPMAEDANQVSVHGVSPKDVKTARKELLSMIENLARDELARSGSVKREVMKKTN